MLGAQLDYNDYLARLKAELDRCNPAEVRLLCDWLYEAWQQGRYVFIIGNGGSAANASHFAEDLGKGTLPAEALKDDSRRRLKVLSLTDNLPWVTALGNDCGYDQVFVQQLMHYGQAGDLLVAISGSGNSPNILAAVDWANRHGLRTFGMTGYDGGKLKKMQQAGIHVELHDMGMVEAIHGCLMHWIIGDLYARINLTGRWSGG